MEKQVYEIPVDVVADIARILLQGGLEHRITDAGRESITMQITFPGNKYKAKQGIEEIISDYNFYRYGENE